MPRTAPGLLAMMLLGSCIYDPDHPCGAHQTYKDGHCFCETTSRINAQNTGCEPCGEHEVGVSNLCLCADNYARETEQGPCLPLGEAFGRACDPTDNPCTDPVYAYCYVPSDGKEPYCTKQGCKFNQDCGTAYGCEIDASPSFCKKYPVGLAKACTANADCAGTEATYCDTFVARICLVQNCASAEVTCYANSVCCDYSNLGTPVSVCVDPAALKDGQCDLGGLMVPD
jgi:hypothetical protein